MKTLYKLLLSFFFFPFYINHAGATVILAKGTSEKSMHFDTNVNNTIVIHYKGVFRQETPTVKIGDNKSFAPIAAKDKMMINRANIENVMANVKIFDEYGRKVCENDLNIQNGIGSMDISNLPQGKYYLQVICELEACSIPFTKL